MFKKITFKKKYEYYFIIIFLLIYTIFIPTKLIKYFVNKIFIPRNIYCSNETFYKGEKILKTKLIHDFLSKISDKYIIEKKVERNKLNKLFNLSYYSNDLFIQSELRAKY